MAWHVSGQMHEVCSCKMLCPCWFGPAEPDQGWCSGALIFDVRQGEADGIDLSGSKVVFAADWPGDFWGGNGTARLYLDEAASPDQRRELEAIFGGRKGGPLEPVLAGVISQWLPAKTARIDVQWGDESSATVGEVGRVQSKRMKSETGETATVRGAAAMGAFQIESMEVARTAGSRWTDPDMRRWEGDSGTVSTFRWSA
jgi:hypothetical protein